ncbi:MAG: DNA polymerase IV [Clostridia bacterium]|nr:DNA polymerase IV [Clostridia bacterium]
MEASPSGNRIILHIDVNSAFLSWEAVYRLQHGSPIDLREIPSVVGGDEESRHGIVLAKSIPAKKYDIHTGEVLWQARSKCPQLVVLPPDYSLYIQCSNALMDLLSEYSPLIERYSVDECFLDVTQSLRGRDPFEYAQKISRRVKKELGFTVNIGVSTNKLLAKMASEFEKPDKVHTLYPQEVPKKMWPLSVKELFMVGRRTAPRLYRLNIFSIGQLAHTDPHFLTAHFKSFGKVLWQYAHGFDDSPVNPYGSEAKGIGNSTTTPFDVDNEKEALLYVLSLVETASARLRQARLLARVVSVSIRKTDLSFFSHQRRLLTPTDNTESLYKVAQSLFQELWDGDPLRHFGVAFSSLCNDQFYQTSLFDEARLVRKKALDSSIDAIRLHFGSTSVVRGSFIHSGIPPLTGGVREDFPGMRSLL